MEDRVNIVSYEDSENKDGEIVVDEVSVKYYQNPDCTEDQETSGYQAITLSTRNNGMARFINIKAENWSISDESDLMILIKDFKKRAGIKDENK